MATTILQTHLYIDKKAPHNARLNSPPYCTRTKGTLIVVILGHEENIAHIFNTVYD